MRRRAIPGMRAPLPLIELDRGCLWWARGLVLISTLIVLTAPLVPGQSSAMPTWREVLCILCSPAGLADGIANVLLFVPLGFALTLSGGAPPSGVLSAGR